ncbi:hypothetical protein GOD90_20310 [Sinorhizobium medicae]|nr:hypothetical protein [Sinorhizobium medicae]MDX0899299.1 hypothetical protein [Sinorhizobium medicae]MDX1120220.1 hypothetical protein [Sinorhizobium medicae]MDX1242702.1 hypothetical protein [Sinorhizobium medicae]
MRFQIAGDPIAIEGLAKKLSTPKAAQMIAAKRKARDRDFSIVEVAITAVVSGAAKMAFDLLAAAIKEKWEKGKAKDVLVASVEGKTIEIKNEEDLERLRQALHVQ